MRALAVYILTPSFVIMMKCNFCNAPFPYKSTSEDSPSDRHRESPVGSEMACVRKSGCSARIEELADALRQATRLYFGSEEAINVQCETCAFLRIFQDIDQECTRELQHDLVMLLQGYCGWRLEQKIKHFFRNTGFGSSLSRTMVCLASLKAPYCEAVGKKELHRARRILLAVMRSLTAEKIFAPYSNALYIQLNLDESAVML